MDADRQSLEWLTSRELQMRMNKESRKPNEADSERAFAPEFGEPSCS